MSFTEQSQDQAVMRFRIRHITTYQYADRVSHCYNLANVVPRTTNRQRCTSNRVIISPLATISHQRTDYFGNIAYHFEIQKPHRQLIITSESEVEMIDAGPDMELSLGMTYKEALEHIKRGASMDIIESREFLLNSPMIRPNDQIRDYARHSFSPDMALHECVRDLTHRIFTEFKYDPGFTTLATPLNEVLEHKRGVCQDFAHLQVACLRSMGIPAKYVSGYIETLPPEGQEKMVGVDATHAWIAYFSPEKGWVEFDPTNDTPAGVQHIVTALGRDYVDVTPVKGVIFGGGTSPVLSVSVDVARLEPKPEPTV